ncbi:MAG TPA: TetR family transcriptional regulator C-terminal domain-containing protein [Vicinamibacteria bacterium]
MPRTANLEARQRILDAAHKLFYTGGLNAVSMDCVAAAAGMKKANLFHYYPTKESLELAVLDHAAASMNERIARVARHSYDPVGAIQRIFEEAAGLMRQSQCSGGCFFGNLAQETADGNETIRQKVAEHLHAWTTELAAFLERWRQAGYFREDFQPQVAAQAILSLLEGALLFCKASKSPEPVDSAKQLAVAYLEAIRA